MIVEGGGVCIVEYYILGSHTDLTAGVPLLSYIAILCVFDKTHSLSFDGAGGWDAMK